MENTKAMSIQIPEETYLRMKAYLERHNMKQREFLVRLMETAMDNQGQVDEIRQY